MARYGVVPVARGNDLFLDELAVHDIGDGAVLLTPVGAPDGVMRLAVDAEEAAALLLQALAAHRAQSHDHKT